MRTWVFVMNTGRLGDWIIRKADTPEEAEKLLTPAQRKKVWYVHESRTREGWRQFDRPGSPPPLQKYGRKAA